MVGYLTKNEEKVLRGWIRYPASSGRELAEIVKMNESSVSVAKHRLLQQGYFKRVIIPDFTSIDCEMITATYGQLPQPPSGQYEGMRDISDLLFCAVDRDRALGIFVSQNFTSMVENMNDFEITHLSSHPSADPAFTYAHLSLRNANLINFFDYSYVFGLDNSQNSKAQSKSKIHLSDLGNREREVLLGIISHPDASDISLAEFVDMRRHTVARHRRTLEESGIIRKAIIPDLDRLGFEVLSLTHCRFNPGSTVKTRAEQIEWVKKNVPHIFLIVSDRESFMISVFRRFHDAKEIERNMLAMFQNYGHVLGPTNVEYYSIPSTQILKNVDCDALVKRIIDVN